MSLRAFVKKVGKVVKKVAPVAANFIPVVGGFVSQGLTQRAESKAQQKASRQAIDMSTGQSIPWLASPSQMIQALPALTVGPQGPPFGGGGLPSISPMTQPSAMPSGGSVFQRFATRAPRPAMRLYRWSFREQRWKAVRRMNPTNVHALRRALRRAESFVKLERRVDKLLRRAAPAARIARKSGFVKSRKR